MTTKKKILETKSDLLIQINSLKEEIKFRDEELYEAGVKERPTIMAKIISKEKATIETVNYLIDSCEKETGRKLPFIIGSHNKSLIHNS